MPSYMLLLYGDQDWSRPDEREANARTIPGARLQVAKDTGHFLSVENPRALIESLDGALDSRT
jgi:pimeloyl-ACP methyl ester carboxylesterase